ncbi:MAG: integrase core domain-containing protein [Chloroflexota bacterium]|nr:integrase core domain-containing protein [Chloroflexota bacterium]
MKDAPRHAFAVVRDRARLVRVMGAQGLVAALALGTCSRRSLFRWKAALARGGLAALVPEPHGPRTRKLKHPAWLEQVVIAVRLHTYWNAKRISAELRRREIALVGHRWIEQLFDDLGTSRPSGPRGRGPRYERSSPNSLWHIDIKGPFWIQLDRKRYLKTFLVGLVDDHSRYVIGLRILPAAGAEPILAWIAECFELCGRPLDLMSDNGTPFVVWMPGVLTRFGKNLRDLEIRHIRTQVNSPWTNGKIESFWATLKSEVLDREVFRSLADAEAALERFSRYYNYHRLHGEIDWCTPAERYDGTPFTDRGFDNVPALAHLVPWLDDLRKAA